jgi:hypothetical protein
MHPKSMHLAFYRLISWLGAIVLQCCGHLAPLREKIRWSVAAVYFTIYKCNKLIQFTNFGIGGMGANGQLFQCMWLR